MKWTAVIDGRVEVVAELATAPVEGQEMLVQLQGATLLAEVKRVSSATRIFSLGSAFHWSDSNPSRWVVMCKVVGQVRFAE